MKTVSSWSASRSSRPGDAVTSPAALAAPLRRAVRAAFLATRRRNALGWRIAESDCSLEMDSQASCAMSSASSLPNCMRMRLASQSLYRPYKSPNAVARCRSECSTPFDKANPLGAAAISKSVTLTLTQCPISHYSDWPNCAFAMRLRHGFGSDIRPQRASRSRLERADARGSRSRGRPVLQLHRRSRAGAAQPHTTRCGADCRSLGR